MLSDEAIRELAYEWEAPCRTIIINDGECDSLPVRRARHAHRMCEVDFGRRSRLRGAFAPGAISGARSGSTWAHAYGEDSPGAIYLKARGGHEDTRCAVQGQHPVPHESTGDQFYREDQFESYRALGREVALEAFGSAKV